MQINRKYVIIAASVFMGIILIAAGGYLYLKNKKTSESSAVADLQSATNAANNITDSATKGVLPSLGEAANPLTNKPDINPTSKTNPFDSVKTNPFQ